MKLLHDRASIILGSRFSRSMEEIFLISVLKRSVFQIKMDLRALSDIREQEKYLLSDIDHTQAEKIAAEGNSDLQRYQVASENNFKQYKIGDRLEQYEMNVGEVCSQLE